MSSSEKKPTGYELTVKLRKTRRRQPLTSTEQALFYELVAICNEVDWDDVFTCSNDELCHVLCISENTLNTARMALINAGLINYASGKSRRKYGSYSFTQKLSNSKPATNPTTSKSGGVIQHSIPFTLPTTSEFEGDTATDNGVNAATDTATNAADYIQTETKPETKPNYDSIESLALGQIADEFSTRLSEERKKGSAQKKKEECPSAALPENAEGVTPHWNAMRKLWIGFYGKRHSGIEPTFGAEAGRSMRSILKRLQAHSTRAPATGEKWTEDYATQVFSHFLNLAYSDEWLSRHFRLSNLASHYDTIIQINSNEQERRPAKAGRKSGPDNVNSGLKRSVYDKLQSTAGKG